MSESIKQLGYYGLVPFVAAVVLIFMQQSLMGITGLELFLTYSAIILSFLTGIWWGMRLVKPEISIGWIILSNVVAVVAWLALLVSYHIFALGLLMAGYFAVWLGDSRLNSAGYIRQTYFGFRSLLSLSVLAMHALVLIVELIENPLY